MTVLQEVSVGLTLGFGRGLVTGSREIDFQEGTSISGHCFSFPSCFKVETYVKFWILGLIANSIIWNLNTFISQSQC
jgi:hypothetical protein